MVAPLAVKIDTAIGNSFPAKSQTLQQADGSGIFRQDQGLYPMEPYLLENYVQAAAERFSRIALVPKGRSEFVANPAALINGTIDFLKGNRSNDLIWFFLAKYPEAQGSHPGCHLEFQTQQGSLVGGCIKIAGAVRLPPFKGLPISGIEIQHQGGRIFLEQP